VLSLVLVAASVGLDNFAASIAIGLAGVDRALRVRVAIVFGLFEAGMPVAGLLLGREVSGSLGPRAHIVGGLLLIAVAAHAGLEALRSRRGAPGGAAPGDAAAALAGVALGRLVVLAAGLSIDNLIVGFALGARRAPLVLAVVLIGVVSVAMSLAGLELGGRLGEAVQERSELLGAAVLAGVGAAILTGLL
jgi:putative Mn2+ efflux pump MntP